MNPETFSTLIELLESRAKQTPDKTALVIEHESLTFSKLWEGICRFGRYLINLGVKSGDRILMVLPNSFEFFFAFYGAQIVQAIAVPISPNSGVKRILNLTEICGASIIVIPSRIPEEQRTNFKESAEHHNIILTSFADSLPLFETDPGTGFPNISSNDIAFLQYTSGSTGNPKGVILTHDNLLTNIRQMIAGMEITRDDIFVSWLPVYHDMGLILKTMVPLYLGTEVFLLRTNLRNIDHWLQVVEQTRATFIAAPDFAYRLCLRHLDPDDYDLSSLRVALNAAEPVRGSTMDRFHKAFKLSNVMVAGYGLAEATVGVSMWASGTKNKIDSRGFVSVGKPFSGIQLKIFTEAGELPPGEVGEIAIHSPANSRGYFQNHKATSATFLDNGFLLSGDLGYLDSEGYLYIISRKKNIIKRVGETISPHEIEEIVDSTPQVRYSATIGIDRGGFEGEQVVVFAEIRTHQHPTEKNLHHLAVGIVNKIYHQVGFRPARVFLLKPKTIPMTHNGKIQHYNMKSIYTNGKLRDDGAILYPEF